MNFNLFDLIFIFLHVNIDIQEKIDFWPMHSIEEE